MRVEKIPESAGQRSTERGTEHGRQNSLEPEHDGCQITHQQM